MYKSLKVYVISVLIFLFFLAPLKAGRPLRIEGVENLGMGGVGTAFNSPTGLLYNPAVLGLRKGFDLTVLNMPVSVSHDVFKFVSFFSDNMDDLSKFSDLESSRQAELMKEITDNITKYRIRLKMGVLNPNFNIGPFPILGPTGNLSFGAGFENRIDAGLKMNRGILVPTIDYWARADGLFYVPIVYSTNYVPFRLPGKIHAGVNLKTVMRSRYEKTRMSILEFTNFDFDADDLKPGFGVGWDVGSLYEYSDRWNFSFVIKDFLSTRIGYSDGSSEVIKGEVDFGASYKLLDSLILAADVRDYNFSDTFSSTLFTKLYVGGQYSPIRFVKLRGGFYQGYPSFGVGLFSKLNYSFYGRELGRYPGMIPEWNHVFSLSLRF